MDKKPDFIQSSIFMLRTVVVHVCQMKKQERTLKILCIMSKKGKFIEEAKHAVEKCSRQVKGL